MGWAADHWSCLIWSHARAVSNGRSTAAVRSGERRGLLGLHESQQPAGQRLEDLALDLRVGVEELMELALAEHEDSQGRLGLHRRQALGVLDERDLAEEVDRPGHRQLPAVAAELDLAVDDDEELVADLAFTGEHTAYGDLELVGEACDLDELLAGEVREERRLLERFDLHVL